MLGFSFKRGPRQEATAEESKWRRILRLNDGGAWAQLFGFDSAAGKTVNRQTTLQLSAAWTCIRLIAGAIAVMPLGFFRKGPDGSRTAFEDDPAIELLTDSPNSEQTAFEFWEGMAAWLATQGNAYAEKGFIGSRLSSLNSLCEGAQPFRNSDGELMYRVLDRGKTEDLPRDKIFHLRGFGYGGDLGLSPIRYGVQSLGSAIAAVESSAKIFSNGLIAAGVLSSEQALKGPQREDLTKIMKEYVGSSKAGKLMVLEAGLKYQQLTLNPDDAQLLETRRFDIEEICRWFGVPPIIVGHAAQGQTMWGSGVEQIMIAWLTLGLNPYLTRIQARIRKDLFAPGIRRTVYAEFNREGLLQADSAAKAAFLSTMVQNGLYTRNEGRTKLNQPKVSSPVADQLTVQSNLAPLDQLGKDSDQQAKAAFLRWLGMDNEGKTAA